MQITEQAPPQGAAPSLDTDPFSDDFLTMPYPHHAQMRDAGPVVGLERYGIWAMARHADVKAVFNDWSSFISSAGVGLANFRTETPFRPKSLILETDPPDHTKARAVLARILSPKMMMQVKAEFTLQAAVDAGLAGIVGECGGSAMCATCHVYVDEQDAGKFAPPDAPEREMLECTASPVRPHQPAKLPARADQRRLHRDRPPAANPAVGLARPQHR